MQPAITVKNLSKTFRLPSERRGTLRERLMKFHQRNEVKARKTLDDINFEVMEGEFFGIIGRNGSGKSTLLKILAGIYRPDKGSEVTIHGRIAPMPELSCFKWRNSCSGFMRPMTATSQIARQPL